MKSDFKILRQPPARWAFAFWSSLAFGSLRET
jgi:hypothetical protein